jgi:regulator of ribonuclease activity A
MLQAEQTSFAGAVAPQATADFCDDNPSAQVLQSSFRSFGGARGCVGPAETISTRDDNSLVKAALEEPGNGRILLIDNQGSTTCAMLGGNLAVLAADNGWAGVIVNGAVRDVEELKEAPVAVFALATCPRRSRKAGLGSRGKPVRVGGVYVRNDDIIAADADGVVCLASWAGR